MKVLLFAVIAILFISLIGVIPDIFATPYDINTAIFSLNEATGQDGTPRGMSWNDDGTKWYFVGDSNNRVYEFNVTSAFDIDTKVFSKSKDISDEDINPTGMSWNNDGTKMYVIGLQKDNVNEYDVSVAFDIAFAVFSKSKLLSGEELNPTDMRLIELLIETK